MQKYFTLRACKQTINFALSWRPLFLLFEECGRRPASRQYDLFNASRKVPCTGGSAAEAARIERTPREIVVECNFFAGFDCASRIKHLMRQRVGALQNCEQILRADLRLLVNNVANLREHA